MLSLLVPSAIAVLSSHSLLRHPTLHIAQCTHNFTDIVVGSSLVLETFADLKAYTPSPTFYGVLNGARLNTLRSHSLPAYDRMRGGKLDYVPIYDDGAFIFVVSTRPKLFGFQAQCEAATSAGL